MLKVRKWKRGCEEADKKQEDGGNNEQDNAYLFLILVETGLEANYIDFHIFTECIGFSLIVDC